MSPSLLSPPSPPSLSDTFSIASLSLCLPLLCKEYECKRIMQAGKRNSNHFCLERHGRAVPMTVVLHGTACLVSIYSTSVRRLIPLSTSLSVQEGRRRGRQRKTMGRQHQRADWPWMDYTTTKSREPRGVEEYGCKIYSGASAIRQTTG